MIITHILNFRIENFQSMLWRNSRTEANQTTNNLLLLVSFLFQIVR